MGAIAAFRWGCCIADVLCIRLCLSPVLCTEAMYYWCRIMRHELCFSIVTGAFAFCRSKCKSGMSSEDRPRLAGFCSCGLHLYLHRVIPGPWKAYVISCEMCCRILTCIATWDYIRTWSIYLVQSTADLGVPMLKVVIHLRLANAGSISWPCPRYLFSRIHINTQGIEYFYYLFMRL